MGNFTDFYKLVTPTSKLTTVQDSQELNNSSAAYGNYTWYQHIIVGSATRLTRYREYDIMDNDVEVARALDMIAEEMTSVNSKTDMVLDLDMQSEDAHDIDSSIVMTVRAALRHWSNMHDFSTGHLFKIARNTIKYGDCFFYKRDDYKKWEWLPTSNIVAAVVDAEDVTVIVGYQVRTDSKVPRTSGTSGAGSSNMPNMSVNSLGGMYSTEYIAAENIVAFTLNDSMSESAPFGESLLRTVYRSHKQKELLEDSIVIYRIQRAPERRVFYIDTGKMPPQRKKQYLETIKNEIRQKKVPSHNGQGQDSMDSVYNPMCLSLDTKIPLLDGRVLTLADIISEHKAGKELWAYSINPKTGESAPGIISWAGITRKDTNVIKITFDNGKTLTCTPDHKIPTQNRGKVEAKDLTVTDSLFPFNMKLEKVALYNHKIVSIEYLTETMDVGTLTIDQEEKYHNYHTFSIDAGVYVYNSMLEDIFLSQDSDGRGSKVEVLPGGQNLGSMEDLQYFMDKVLRGLRVPIAWMKPGNEGAIFNDGKVGASYIEEQQFARFVHRQQIYLEHTLDVEFKKFLFSSNINVDGTLFKVKLPSPSNYEKYKQADIDSTLLNSLSTVDGITYLSKRFILSRYLQLTEDEIITNEELLKQERGLDPDSDHMINTLYAAPTDSMAAGGLGLGGAGLDGMGGALPPGGELPADGALPAAAGDVGASIPLTAGANPPPV